MKYRKCYQQDCAFLNSDGSRNPIQCYDSGCDASDLLGDRYCPVCGSTGLQEIHTHHPLDYQHRPIKAPMAHSFWHCKKCGSRGYDILEKEIERPEQLLAPFAYSERCLEMLLKAFSFAPTSCPLCKTSHSLTLIAGSSHGFNIIEEVFYCSHCQKQVLISQIYKTKERVVTYLSKKAKCPKYPVTLALDTSYLE